MFEKVSRSLKYDSNFFFRSQTYYKDTTADHFTPIALRVWGNWASEASPTLGCSIEISRGMSVGMYVCMSVVVQKA